MKTAKRKRRSRGWNWLRVGGVQYVGASVGSPSSLSARRRSVASSRRARRRVVAARTLASFSAAAT